ncbi:uncharacterized protein LOC144058030 isoform X2 [Vanacampus margaritifer]
MTSTMGILAPTLASIRSYFNADAYNLLEELVEMTFLSEHEQRMYNAEKAFMRQYVLLAKENRVPPCLSPKDMKVWLLKRRSFQREYQDMRTNVDDRMFYILYVAWTMARVLRLNKMQREVNMEVHEEQRLSRLLGRKVTLQGLHRYLSALWPQAERDTDTFLCHLLNDLLTLPDSTEMTVTQKLFFHPLLNRALWSLVRTMVESALRVLLQELEPPANERSVTATLVERSMGASEEIGRMLIAALISIPRLSPEYIAQDELVRLCSVVALKITQSLFQKFVECFANFPLMDSDDTSVTARDSVVSAIVQMVYTASHENPCSSAAVAHSRGN